MLFTYRCDFCDEVKALAKDKEFLSTEEWARMVIERDFEIKWLRKECNDLNDDWEVLQSRVEEPEY